MHGLAHGSVHGWLHAGGVLNVVLYYMGWGWGMRIGELGPGHGGGLIIERQLSYTCYAYSHNFCMCSGQHFLGYYIYFLNLIIQHITHQCAHSHKVG